MFKSNANSNSRVFRFLARAEEKLGAAATSAGAALVTLGQAVAQITTVAIVATPATETQTFSFNTSPNCFDVGQGYNSQTGWYLTEVKVFGNVPGNNFSVTYDLYHAGVLVQEFTQQGGQATTFNQGTDYITVTTQGFCTNGNGDPTGANVLITGGSIVPGQNEAVQQLLSPFLADHAAVITIGGLALLAVGVSFLVDYRQNGVARRVVYRLDAGMPLGKSMGSTSEKRLRMLGRRPPEQQDAILAALARRHAPDAASELKRIARANKGLSKKAVDALSESGTRSALGALKGLVLNSNPETRALAFEALTKWALSDNSFAPIALEIISEFTSSQSEEIRSLTYKSMKKMCDASPADAAKVIAPITELVPLGAISINDSISEANKVLLDLLGSEHPEVVRAAASAVKAVLGKLGTKECRIEEISIIAKALPAGAFPILCEVAPEYFKSN